MAAQLLERAAFLSEVGTIDLTAELRALGASG
jgi:hypothetical protein